MSIEDDIAELYKSLEKFSEDCTVVRKQVRNIYRRARDEETDIMKAPLKVRREGLKEWWAKEGADAPLTIENVVICLFKKCEKDVAARTITLEPSEGAIFGWKNTNTITVFDLMALLPKLFM
jgi:hypothetical protein